LGDLSFIEQKPNAGWVKHNAVGHDEKKGEIAGIFSIISSQWGLFNKLKPINKYFNFFYYYVFFLQFVNSFVTNNVLYTNYI
jgi:hypothetical protein